MKNVSKKYKVFSESEQKEHLRIFENLKDIKDSVDRYIIAGEILKDKRSQEYDIGV